MPLQRVAFPLYLWVFIEVTKLPHGAAAGSRTVSLGQLFTPAHGPAQVSRTPVLLDPSTRIQTANTRADVSTSSQVDLLNLDLVLPRVQDSRHVDSHDSVLLPVTTYRLLLPQVGVDSSTLRTRITTSGGSRQFDSAHPEHHFEWESTDRLRADRESVV